MANFLDDCHIFLGSRCQTEDLISREVWRDIYFLPSYILAPHIVIFLVKEIKIYLRFYPTNLVGSQRATATNPKSKRTFIVPECSSSPHRSLFIMPGLQGPPSPDLLQNAFMCIIYNSPVAHAFEDIFSYDLR